MYMLLALDAWHVSMHCPSQCTKEDMICSLLVLSKHVPHNTSVTIASAMQIKQDQRKQQHDPVAQATKQYQQQQQRKSEQCRVHLKVRPFSDPQPISIVRHPLWIECRCATTL